MSPLKVFVALMNMRFCSSAFAELVIWYHISTQRPTQNDRHYHTAFATLFHSMGLFYIIQITLKYVLKGT